MEEIRTEMSKRGKENCSESILDGMPDVRAALQRDAAAAYAPPEVRPWLPGSQGHSPGGTLPGLHAGTELCTFWFFHGRGLIFAATGRGVTRGT